MTGEMRMAEKKGTHGGTGGSFQDAGKKVLREHDANGIVREGPAAVTRARRTRTKAGGLKKSKG